MNFSKLRRVAAAAVFFVLFAVSAAFADAWTPDTSWYDDYKDTRGTKENPFLISTPEELAGLAELVNVERGWGVTKANLTEKYILLTRDINLENKEWRPIGWYLSYTTSGMGPFTTQQYEGFDGVFDGGGHTISGLLIETCENVHIYKGTTQTEAAGLFGYIAIKGEVRNLTVKGRVNASQCEGAGGIAGWADGKIENCVTDVDVLTTSSKRGYAGGIAGLNGGPQGDNMTSTNPYAIISNNVIFGSVTSTPGAFGYAGGVVGFSHWYKGEVRNNVVLSKSIISSMDAGGIFGGFNSFVTADNVSAAEKVEGAPGCSGGIVGAFGFGYQNCYWLSATRDQPAGGTTDPALLPVAAAVMETEDFKTMKSGETRSIRITAYPTTADHSSLTYNWSVDESALEIVEGQGTSTLTVRAKDGITDPYYAKVSADVTGLLGHTEGGTNVYISNFDTAVSLEGVLKIVSSPIPVEGISAYGAEKPLGEGEKVTLGVSVRPSDAETADWVWTLSGVGGAASEDDVITETLADGSLSIFLRTGHEEAYSYTFTVSTADGQFSDSVTVTGDVVDDVEIDGFIPAGDAVVNYTDAVKPVGATSDEVEDVAAAAGTDTSSFRISSTGVLYLNSGIIYSSLRSAEERDQVTITASTPLPVMAFSVSNAERLAAAGLIVSGETLNAATVGDVHLIVTRPGGSGEFFAYAEDKDAIGNKRFTLQRMDDTMMGPDDAINAEEQYKLVLYIQDNSDFDFAQSGGDVISAVSLVWLSSADSTDPSTPEDPSTPPASSGGSGGGCNAGAGILALLAGLPLISSLHKKKRGR